jgi:endonuclease G
MLRFIVICGLTILVNMTFVACQQEREETFPDNRPVVFAPLHSVWGGGVLSRAYDTTWEAGDEVGIYMLKDGNTSLDGDNVIAANVPYRIINNNTSADLVPVGAPINYPTDDSPVNFVAYYPYKDDVITSYPVNVANQADDIDLMIHKEVGTAYRLSQGIAVPLNFKHKLSRLVITAIPDEGTGIVMTDATLTISGMPTTATCDLYSGTFSGWADIGDIDPRRKNPGDTERAEWEAIIIPHSNSFTCRTFTIHAGDEQYIFMLRGEDYNITFEAGQVYEREFKLLPPNVDE